MSTERSWWTPYLYATLFGCTATIVEVVSKTSLVGQLVAEKHQAAVYGMERGLLNLGFSMGPLVGGAIYEDSFGLPYTVSACCLCVSSLVYLTLPGRPGPGGEHLLEDMADGDGREAWEHMGNQAPLPAKRIGAVIAAERARRVYFVCPELYEAYQNKKTLVRRHSGGEVRGSGFSGLGLGQRSNTIGEPLSHILGERPWDHLSVDDGGIRYSDPDLTKSTPAESNRSVDLDG